MQRRNLASERAEARINRKPPTTAVEVAAALAEEEMIIIHHNHDFALEMQKELENFNEEIMKVADHPEFFEVQDIEKIEVTNGRIALLDDYTKQ